MLPQSFLGNYESQRRALLVLAAALFVWNLWGYDVWAPDEPYFAEGAREMIADGQWLVPHINGQVSSDKPPLFFWLIALFSMPFGSVSSFTARLPSMLAALGTVALTLRLARRIYGPTTAVLAGVILVTMYMFWEKARWAQIDALLCFLILIALSAFEEFRSGARPGRRAGLVFWGAVALAALAKGPVGVLLPVGIAILTLLSDRSLSRWRSFAPFSGPLLFVAIVGLWIGSVAIFPVEGYTVAGALREHFVERGIRGMHHAQPPWYYLTVLPYALAPWSLLLPGALLVAWRDRRDAGTRYLLLHSVFVVTFFTVSTEKRDLYILPALPALAILIAGLLTLATGARESDDSGVPRPGTRWVTVPQGLCAAILLLAGITAPLAAKRLYPDLLAAAILLAAVLLVGGGAILLAAIRGRSETVVRATAVTMAVLLLAISTFLYPALNPSKSGRELAAKVEEAVAQMPAESKLLAVELRLPRRIEYILRHVNLYSEGIYFEEIDPEDLAPELATGQEVLVLAAVDRLEPLSPQAEARKSILYETTLSRQNILLLRFHSGAGSGE